MLRAALLLMPESRPHPFGLVVSGEPLDLWIRWHPRGKTQDLCIRTGPTSYNQHPTPLSRGRSLAGSCIPALIWAAPKSKGCLPASLRDLRAALLLDLGSGCPTAEVNISSYPGTRVPGLFFHSRAVIFKSGCFVQKYWSGTVMRNAAVRRAADY